MGEGNYRFLHDCSVCVCVCYPLPCCVLACRTENTWHDTFYCTFYWTDHNLNCISACLAHFQSPVWFIISSHMKHCVTFLSWCRAKMLHFKSQRWIDVCLCNVVCMCRSWAQCLSLRTCTMFCAEENLNHLLEIWQRTQRLYVRSWWEKRAWGRKRVNGYGFSQHLNVPVMFRCGHVLWKLTLV